MTLENIAEKLPKWQAQYDRYEAKLSKIQARYEADKERWNRQINPLTVKMYKLKQKITKNKPYATYYNREKGE